MLTVETLSYIDETCQRVSLDQLEDGDLVVAFNVGFSSALVELATVSEIYLESEKAEIRKGLFRFADSHPIWVGGETTLLRIFDSQLFFCEPFTFIKELCEKASLRFLTEPQFRDRNRYKTTFLYNFILAHFRYAQEPLFEDLLVKQLLTSENAATRKFSKEYLKLRSKFNSFKGKSYLVRDPDGEKVILVCFDKHETTSSAICLRTNYNWLPYRDDDYVMNVRIAILDEDMLDKYNRIWEEVSLTTFLTNKDARIRKFAKEHLER